MDGKFNDLGQKIIGIFPRRYRSKLLIFIVLLLVAAGLEMVGVGLIMPLIAIIDQPEIVQNNQWFAKLFEYLGAQSHKNFLVMCSVGLIIFYLLKNIFIGVLIYLQSRFLAQSEAEVAMKLLENYLYMPYEKYLERNPATLVNNINFETSVLFAGLIKPGFIIITDAFVVMSILALLTYIAPLATFAAVGTIGVAGVLFYLPLRGPLLTLGQSRQYHREKMVQWINQSLGSLKEIVVFGRRVFFRNSFKLHAQGTVKTQVFYETVVQLPRLIIESIGVITLLVVTIVVLFSDDNFLPVLSVFAMAAFRLMPAMNRITTCATKVRYYVQALNTVHNDLFNIQCDVEVADKKCVKFSEKITLNNISFTYPGTEKEILSNISLDIGKGESIGIIGLSGAGKSTLVDLMLGLLAPTSGSVQLDGVDIRDCMSSWRKHISYIPQTIYLIDDSVRRNIALGINDDDIDDDKVWRALEKAELADVVSGMPGGLDEIVGERGIKISGGQRQRIGIARAFYNEPEVLILDEATTGLDPKTEKAICDTLCNMKKDLTMIAISHQPALTAVADKVYMLDEGKITVRDDE